MRKERWMIVRIEFSSRERIGDVKHLTHALRRRHVCHFR